MQIKKCAIHEKTPVLADTLRINVCRDLPANHEYERNFYCVLHLPDENKSRNTDFVQVVNERVDNGLNDFSYIFVPDQVFHKKQFTGREVRFNSATFLDEASFGGVSFNTKINFFHTNFEQGADFDKAEFKDDVRFDYAVFTGGGFFRNAQFNKKAKFWKSKFSSIGFFHDANFMDDTDFSYVNFSKNVNFDNAVFKKSANFNVANFGKYAYFSGAEFLTGADFADGIFNDKTFFLKTVFNHTVDFSKVRFTESSQVDFNKTIFRGKVYFYKTIVEGYMEFLGTASPDLFLRDGAWLSLEQTRVENAKRISFKNVLLRPSWFSDVDLRKFIFIDIDWKNASGSPQETSIELNALIKKEITGRPHRLLGLTCSQLASNYEERSDYEHASNFRRMAMELAYWGKISGLREWIIYSGKIILLRIKGQKKDGIIYRRWKSINKPVLGILKAFDLPHFLYRWLSYYGESYGRALGVLLVMLLIFALILMFVDFQVCSPEGTAGKFCETRTLNFGEAIRHSLATATFQTAEVRKIVAGWGEILVTLEKIFIPIQATLLALAIRRKFMR